MNESSGTIVERYEIDWNDDKQILDYILSRWAAKDYYKGGLEKKWLKIIATYEGFPYLEFDESYRLLTEDFEVPAWRVNLVVNLLLPKIRTNTARYLRNRPIWDVLPATNDTSDIDRAGKSKKALQSFWYNSQMNYDFISLLLWIGLTGNAFASVSWNPNIGPEYVLKVEDFVDQQVVQQLQGVPLDDQKKQALVLLDAQKKFEDFVTKNNGTNYPLGEVEINIPSPFDILFPWETKFSKVPWCIEARVREVSYYADMGLDPKIFSSPTEKEARHLFFAKRLYNLFQIGTGQQHASAKTREVLELALWLPKSRQFRQGFFAVAAGGKILQKGPNPYQHGEIPIVHFKAEESPGKIWGFSSAEMALPIINEYQKTKSQITEIKNQMAKPKWLVPKSARISESALTSEPGEVVEYAGALPPTQSTPTPLPSYMIHLPEMDRRDIDDIMAIHDASQGKNPSGSRSGLMNVNLQEQDEGQLAITGLNIDTGLSKTGRFTLSTQDQFYKEDRVLSYLGEKKRFQVFTVNRGDLSGKSQLIGVDYFHVIITQFSQFGLSRAGQLEALKSLLQYNVFRPEERDKIFKFLNIGFIEDELDEFQVDRSNAYKENLMMSQGQPVAPDLSDEDKIHVEEHKIFMKGDEYRAYPPQIKSLFQKHMQDHKLYQIMKLVEPQILAIPAQMMACTLNGIDPKMLEMANAGRDQGSGSQGNGSSSA